MNGHSAVFEFGNLAKRVQRRIGQQIGSRLLVGKGDEHRALWRSIVLATNSASRQAVFCSLVGFGRQIDRRGRGRLDKAWNVLREFAFVLIA